MNLKTVIFIGRSGCGKGSQIEGLTNYLKENDSREVFHLESGERFRSFIKEDNYSSQLSLEISEAGLLQPAFLSIWAWTSELINKIKSNQHLLIDGTPRRQIEAEILESAFAFYGRKKIEVIYINVSKEWAIEKMLARGRQDDKEMANILARMDWFDSDVKPVIDFYKTHPPHVFYEINGEQTIKQVQEEILKLLEK